MIRNFRHSGLEELHATGKSRKVGQQFIRKYLRILDF